MKEVLKSNKIDIFMIQETKMIAADKPTSIGGYTILPKLRKQPRGKEADRGGGIMIGIDSTLPYSELKEYDNRNTPSGREKMETDKRVHTI